jgi:hypothetical protein
MLQLVLQKENVAHRDANATIAGFGLNFYAKLCAGPWTTRRQTGRRWLRFVKRWQAHISPNLKQACIGCNASLLYPGRRSNKRGGRAEVSEAGYFLSLTPPASTRSSGSFTLVAPKETSYPQPSEPRDLESSFKFLEAVKEIKELHAQAALLNFEIEIKLKKLSDLMLCKYL